MKATGIVRRIDDLGRLVIPKEIRKTYNLEEGNPVEFYTDNNRIILAKYQPPCACVFCDEAEGVTEFRGKRVCPDCRSALSNN
ncbi:MAG: AbrB/MazE/SpoVT family DNA-binding domain-containing protein [Pelosinus sp.]|nr:AbrB/MazE/SpoVT family DNA-binding domain-containing protein [Pelosinus sp.]